METQLRAAGEHLKQLDKKYGGKYNELLGQFLHIAQVTRMDLAFTYTHFGSFNVVPNKAAFQGLKRMQLPCNLHAPIFHPWQNLTMYQTICFGTSQAYILPIPNFRARQVDAL